MLMLWKMRLSQDTAMTAWSTMMSGMAAKMSFCMYITGEAVETTRCMSLSQGAKRCSMLEGRIAQKAAVQVQHPGACAYSSTIKNANLS